MLSHLSGLLWVPSMIMTVERPTQRRSRDALPPERAGIMGNFRVIDPEIKPPEVDPVSSGYLPKAEVLSTDCFDIRHRLFPQLL